MVNLQASTMLDAIILKIDHELLTSLFKETLLTTCLMGDLVENENKNNITKKSHFVLYDNKSTSTEVRTYF